MLTNGSPAALFELQGPRQTVGARLAWKKVPTGRQLRGLRIEGVPQIAAPQGHTPRPLRIRKTRLQQAIRRENLLWSVVEVAELPGTPRVVGGQLDVPTALRRPEGVCKAAIGGPLRHVIETELGQR